MKIAIVGGFDRADFLTGFLLEKKHKLIIINEDKKYCEYLSATHEIPIIFGDPRKQYVLSDAGIFGYDVLIALTEVDADNLSICQMAKKQFNIKKVVCTVANPKNVEVFKKLGVNTVISATYMLAKFIEQASTIENLIKTLAIEDDKVLLSEVILEESWIGVGKKVAQLEFPQDAIISCILRGNQTIVPNGQTQLATGDKLLIISSPKNQIAAVNAVSGGKLK